jgi:hypothetical protein
MSVVFLIAAIFSAAVCGAGAVFFFGGVFANNVAGTARAMTARTAVVILRSMILSSLCVEGGNAPVGTGLTVPLPPSAVNSPPGKKREAPGVRTSLFAMRGARPSVFGGAGARPTLFAIGGRNYAG